MTKSITNSFGWMRKRKVAMAVALSSSISHCSAWAEVASEYNLNIQAKDTETALLELAEAAGVQIMFSPDLVRDISSPGLSGSLTIDEALISLLNGTNLVYQKSAEKVFIIKRKETQLEEDLEEVVVTGSAIRNVNPTSSVETYTAEDISRMGVSSIEDFLRKLPQNYSGHNTFTSTDLGHIDIQGASGDSVNTAAADLHGLGNDATLVLINGRRTAQSAKFDGGVVNLTSIPISAIERVEIVLDGASSRYGSDAIGGVINFITKKDYVGSEMSVRYEDSLNGGNKFRLNQLIGYNWDTGGITTTLSFEESKPVDSSRLGYTTSDQRPRGGFDWRNNQLSSLQPGVVYDSRNAYDACVSFYVSWYGLDLPTAQFFCAGEDPDDITRGDLIGSLPEGHDGVSWTVADLSPDNRSTNEWIPQDQGVFSEMTSFTLNVNQDVTDSINVFADLLYSKSEATNKGDVARLSPVYVYVPESNAFNNAGKGVYVGYFPIAETASGSIPSIFSISDQVRLDATVGLTADLPVKDWQARVNLSYSEDSAKSVRLRPSYIGPDKLFNEPDSGYLARYKRFEALLRSDDPAEAINLFGNGSVQSPFLSEIYGNEFTANPESITKGLEANLDGGVVSLPGGEVRAALGIEYRESERDYKDDTLRSESFEFTKVPNQDQVAVYGEIDIPLVGDDNALPLVKSLQLNIGARWEEYAMYDAFAVELASDYMPDVQKVGDVSFSSTSPRVGINWQLVDDFRIRASWGESFRAPSYVELLGNLDILTQESVGLPLCVNDPLDPDVPGQEVCNVSQILGANPELKPEVATTTSVGFEWTPAFASGLLIKVDAKKIEFNNRIAAISSALTDSEIISDPEFGLRDDAGYLRALRYKSVNLAAREVEAVDFSLRYDFSTNWGDFQTSLVGVYTGELYDQLSSDQEKQIQVGTQRGPADWKGRFSVNWQYNSFGANLFLNYSGSYINDFSYQGNDYQEKVDAYWYVDASGHYEFGNGWRLEAGINNLANNTAPFFNVPMGYDARLYNPNGRIVYAEVKKSFDF